MIYYYLSVHIFIPIIYYKSHPKNPPPPSWVRQKDHLNNISLCKDFFCLFFSPLFLSYHEGLFYWDWFSTVYTFLLVIIFANYNETKIILAFSDTILLRGKNRLKLLCIFTEIIVSHFGFPVDLLHIYIIFFIKNLWGLLLRISIAKVT